MGAGEVKGGDAHAIDDGEELISGHSEDLAGYVGAFGAPEAVNDTGSGSTWCRGDGEEVG